MPRRRQGPGSAVWGCLPAAWNRPHRVDANSMAMRSACSRRATKPRTASDSSSRQCASSTTQSNGRVEAASANSDNVPTPTRNRFGGSPCPRPNADSNAARCRAGSPETPSRTGPGAGARRRRPDPARTRSRRSSRTSKSPQPSPRSRAATSCRCPHRRGDQRAAVASTSGAEQAVQLGSLGPATEHLPHRQDGRAATTGLLEHERTRELARNGLRVAQDSSGALRVENAFRGRHFTPRRPEDSR